MRKFHSGNILKVIVSSSERLFAACQEMAVIIVDAGEVFDTHGLAMAILSESVQILRFEFLVPFETVMSAPPLDLKLPHKTASRHRSVSLDSQRDHIISCSAHNLTLLV